MPNKETHAPFYQAYSGVMGKEGRKMSAGCLVFQAREGEKGDENGWVAALQIGGLRSIVRSGRLREICSHEGKRSREK